MIKMIFCSVFVQLRIIYYKTYLVQIFVLNVSGCIPNIVLSAENLKTKSTENMKNCKVLREIKDEVNK